MTNEVMQTGIAAEQLKQYVERIEKLEDEKASISADIREVYNRAKGEGFEPKVIRKVIKLRSMDSVEREEEESLLDIYLHALGMVKESE